MTDPPDELEKLRRELAEVKERLKLAEETLDAIRSGEVDALVITTQEGNRIFTLEGADHTYQVLVEQMGEGAATVADDGLILYANQRLSELLNYPLKNLIGSHLQTMIAPQDRQEFLSFLEQANLEVTLTKELSLITAQENQEILVKLSLKKFNIDELLVNSLIITDITESKLKEATKINQILNSVIAAITSYRAFPNNSWIFDYWSQGCEQLFGYTAAELMADQNLFSSRIFPKDLAALIEQTFADYKLGRNNHVQYRFQHKDGSWRWIASSQIVEWDQTNHCWNGTGVLTDITQRKQAEIDLREAQTIIKQQEEQFRLALDLTQTGIWDWNLSTGVIHWNDSHYTLLGYQPGTITPAYLAWRDRVHPDDVIEVEQKLLRSQENDSDYEAEFRVIYPDGSIHWILGKGKTLDDEAGQPIRMIGTIVDITQRKQTEIALREQEAKLSLFIKYAPVSVAMFDQQMRYLTVSQRWLEMYQLGSEEAIIGHSHYEIFPNISDAWKQSHQQCLTGATQKCEQDYFILPDGSEQWLNWEIQPWRFNNGEVGGIVIFVEDITQRKQIARERLVTNIAQNIRQTLDLNQILQTTVEKIRELLQADRTIILRFQPDWTVTVITESVNPNYPTILNSNIYDPCFIKEYIEPYRQGLVTTRSDFEADDIAPCYRELMRNFQVRANLAVPILQEDQLWGLLVVHQCSSTHQWQSTEIQLLQQLAIQVSIAIQQSELYQRTLQELLERKQAQKALFESEQKLQAILEYAPAVIYLMDLENRHLLLNRRYAELLNTTADNLLGKSLYDIWPKEVADIFAANNLKIVQNKQVVEAEEIVPQSDGLHTYISLKFPLCDTEGKVYAVCGISTDITERKQAEQKIAEQAALIDLANDAIFVHDLDDQILFWSQGAERLYGWTEAEVLGQKTQTLFNKDSEINVALQTTIEEGNWQGELEQITKTGTKIIVQSNKNLVKNLLSQPRSILVVNSDITEKKALEKQFYHIQRLESLGTLASGIAHDFNNILTPILGVSQLLPLKLPNLDETNQRLLTLLANSAQRGVDLVKQILLFSRDTEGQTVVVKPDHLLRELIGIAQETFPKSITILPEIPTQELWTILADPTQIHQVFMNLIVNARDAMLEGGTLSIIAENHQLNQPHSQMNLEAKPGAYVVVTITDTGMGISPKLLERIFDPFFTTKGVGKGTGLGLSTVRGIVKNHGGFINVYSELGKGTKFQVFLPAIQEESNSLTPEAEMLKGNGELILIVDDETSIQEVTRVTLENYNYRTMTASDGNEALSIFTQHQQEISVILIDMMMPNLDGITTIRTLRQINPLVKIIATSGLLTNKQLASEVDVKTFLLKPYTTRQLLEALTEVMGIKLENPQ